MRFLETNLKITKEFLMTAVVLDDEAEFSDRVAAEEAAASAAGQLVEPAGQTTTASDAGGTASVRLARPQGNKLNAKEIIDGFARLGLFCAVLKPKDPAEALSSSTITLAKKADLVILDWSLGDDGGKTALDLLTLVIEPVRQPARYRVIAVYTAERDLAKVAEEIKAHLEKESLDFVVSGDLGLEFVLSHTLIGVYAKGHVNVAPQISSRKVKPEDLPAVLVREFGQLTCGLLTHMVLAALGKIRSHTHLILAKFDRRLDAAFLAHRALLATPEEAEDIVAPLITSEIESLLEDDASLEAVRLDALNEYLDAHTAQLDPSPSGLAPEEHLEFLKTALEKGILSSSTTSAYAGVPAITAFLSATSEEGKSAAAFQLANIFRLDDEQDDSPHLELAVLMSVKTRYNSASPPTLGPGVVVTEGAGANPKVWLCVQPICDSVRINGKRRFDFLRLERSDTSFGYVLPYDGTSLKVKLKRKLYDGTNADFQADAVRKTVLARRPDGFAPWIFAAVGGRTFKFVAELKVEQTMRALNVFTTDHGRVGLSESEWLRRHGG